MTFRKPRATVLLTIAALSAVLAVALGSFATTAGAQRGRLRATIYVTQASIPRGLSEKALIGFARGHASRQLNESSEPQIENRHWLANMVASFSAPPGDLEYHALFYDMTDGTRNFVDDMAIYVHDRDQRTYVQRLNLGRPRFRPNRRYQLVITVRQQEVGNTQFDTRGEEPRRSGQVDFSVEDTRARDDD